MVCPSGSGASTFEMYYDFPGELRGCLKGSVVEEIMENHWIFFF